jgi:hypothetical protein
MDDHLLTVEGGVEVRDDADLPAGGVRLAPFWEREGLGRRPIFATFVEGTALEFFRGLWFGLWLRSAGPVGSPGGDDDLAAGERVDAEVDCQPPSPPPPARWRSGPISSIGSGRISVDVRSELISSIVCR